jgi:Spy/CpxP family protein refolding chaperone
MVKELALIPEQTTQVEQLNKDQAAALAQLQQAGLEPEAKKARAQVLREKYDNRMKSVLTAEQYEKFVAMRKAKRDAAMQKRQQVQAAPSSK